MNNEVTTFYNAHRLILRKFGRLWGRLSLALSVSAGSSIMLLLAESFAQFLVIGIFSLLLLVGLIFLLIYTIGLNIKDSLVREGLAKRLKVITILVLLFIPFGVTLPASTQNYNHTSYEGLMKKLQGLDSLGIDSDNYRRVLGWRESRDNYQAINSGGYLGKYQFSRKTLRGLRKQGYLIITDKEIKTFTEHPELQEKAMDALIVCNDAYFKRNGCYKYLNKKITKEGMLAAAHLVGPNAVRNYIRSGKLDSTMIDGNGVTLVDYLTMFN